MRGLRVTIGALAILAAASVLLASGVGGADPEHAAEVVVRGSGDGAGEEELFVREALLEIVREAGVTDADVQAVAGDEVVERGPLNWRWVRAALTALDRLPNVSAWSVALATRDVYQYLHNVRVRDTIESGVRRALDDAGEAVVVAHSLGTVVAYNLLRREAADRGWQVPLLVTLGSPLAVSAISRTLRPLSWPEPVGTWFNAFDPEDVVALHPLTAPHFAVDRIEKSAIGNSPQEEDIGVHVAKLWRGCEPGNIEELESQDMHPAQSQAGGVVRQAFLGQLIGVFPVDDPGNGQGHSQELEIGRIERAVIVNAKRDRARKGSNEGTEASKRGVEPPVPDEGRDFDRGWPHDVARH